MQLDRFQRFVKDNYQDNDLTGAQIEKFVIRLHDEFNDEYELYLVEWISQRMDAVTFTENLLSSSNHKNLVTFNSLRKKAVCSLIYDTLEEVEDIEIGEFLDYQEDCCDAHKREQELNQ